MAGWPDEGDWHGGSWLARHEPKRGIEVDQRRILDGKSALVTGASGGLGARAAKVLAGAGATVVLAGRRIARLQVLQAEITAAGGVAFVVELDVTNADSVEEAVASAEVSAGRLDILVNNSGVATAQRLVDASPDDFDYLFNTNTRGAFLVARAVARRMIAREGTQKPPCRMVNIASVAGMRVLPDIGLYSASKAALIFLTKAMALEWGPLGVNVNAICPGYVDTDIHQGHWSTEAGFRQIETLPRRRVALPEDLDGVLLLLASDASQFVNGAVIPVDDGFGLS